MLFDTFRGLFQSLVNPLGGTDFFSRLYGVLNLWLLLNADRFRDE
jgi:hypothetical protein